MKLSELNETYEEWELRQVTGNKYPQLAISKELRKIGIKVGDKVLVGVRNGVIEIRKVD